MNTQSYNDSAYGARSATINGVTVAYHDLGSGPCAVLIHGGGPGASGWSNFSRNAEALAERFRVLIVDLPGFGRSEKPPLPDKRYQFFASIILGLLDHLAVRRASLVGNSLGAMVSLRFALDFPERAKKLVLMGAPGWLSLSVTPTEGVQHLMNYYRGEGPTREKLRAFLACMVADRTGITDEIVEERFAASIDPEVIRTSPLASNSPAIGEALWREDVSCVTHPTLLVWGREDRVVPLDGAFPLLKQLPNGRLHVFAPCGHWAQWEHANRFNKLVAGFLTH